jgi:hypothetical protein
MGAAGLNLATDVLATDVLAKPFKEILDAPPSALAGVSENDAVLLKQAFGIDTVREFGSNKYFALAVVLVALENKEG